MTSPSPADRLRLTPADDSSSTRQPRRTVDLTGFGVIEDGTTFNVRVLDLSYDGCKVETSLALFPGLKLKVSILGIAGALDAVVRWYKDGKAGIHFDADPEPEHVHKPRCQERLQVSAGVSIRRQGRQPYQSRMFDLTPTGCKVEFIERPKVDEHLWVKFEGLDGIECVVRWMDGFYGGLEFIRPIYPAVFELLLAKLKH